MQTPVFDVNLLGAFLLFALMTEGLVENLKWTIEDIKGLFGRSSEEAESWNGARLIALVVAVAFAVVYQIDLFSSFGFSTGVPYIGSVATGVLFARGSNWIYDFLSAAQARIAPKDNPLVG